MVWVIVDRGRQTTTHDYSFLCTVRHSQLVAPAELASS